MYKILVEKNADNLQKLLYELKLYTKITAENKLVIKAK